VAMSPRSSEESRDRARRSTWWVGRGSDNRSRSGAVGLIAIGAVGLMSFAPFYDSNAQIRGWDWLPLAIWMGFVGIGAYRLIGSFRR
jgi:hypothetical protein